MRNEIYYLIYDNDITNFTLNLKLLDTFCENEDYDKLEEMLKIEKWYKWDKAIKINKQLLNLLMLMKMKCWHYKIV